MAITILPGQSTGSQIGTGLGEVLSGGLQNLAHMKTQQLMQRQQRHQQVPGLQALGFNPQEASAISGLDPQIQREVIKQRLQGPSNQLFAEALNGITGTPQQQAGLQQALGTPQQQQMQPSQQQGQMGQQQAQQPQGMPSPAAPGALAGQQQPTIPAGLKPQQALQLAQLGLQKQQLSKKEATEQRKQEFAERQAANRETKVYYDKLLSEDEASKKGDMRLNRMQELIEKGSLPYSTTYRLFKNLSESDIGKHVPLIGPLISMVVNPIVQGVGGAAGAVQRNITARDTEEFEKLQNDFVRDAKSIFGARITNQDLGVYLSMIPTLMQSDNGKQAVIRNMKSFNEATKVKAKIMKQIIKDNGGKRPDNLPLLVEEQAQPQLEKIAQQFKEGLPSEESLALG